MSSTAIFFSSFLSNYHREHISASKILLPAPCILKALFPQFLCLLGPHFSSLHQFLLGEASPDFPKYSSPFHFLFTIWEKLSLYPSMYLIIYLPANLPTLCNFPHNWGRKPMKQNLYFFLPYPKHIEQSKYICLEEEICPDGKKRKEFQ